MSLSPARRAMLSILSMSCFEKRNWSRRLRDPRAARCFGGTVEGLSTLTIYFEIMACNCSGASVFILRIVK